MERNIGFKERRYIEELRILTKSTALDCVTDDRFDRVIYVIRPGDMGLAIGKKRGEYPASPERAWKTHRDGGVR